MSSYIKEIQTVLKNAGYYKGEVDGIAGPQTVTAAKNAANAKTLVLSSQDCKAVEEQSVSDPTLVETQVLTPVNDTAPKSKFVLSAKSLQKLQGVHTPLVNVVKLAITLTRQDFMVLEGVRSVQRQKQLLAQGATQTMSSRHITGDAVDLVPIVNGAISWDFKHYYEIARAMQQAAKQLGVKVRWGGAWTVLNDTTKTPEQLTQDYVASKKKVGQKAFTDGPHFELPQ